MQEESGRQGEGIGRAGTKRVQVLSSLMGCNASSKRGREAQQLGGFQSS